MDENGVLYSADKTQLIYCPPMADHTNVTILDTVTSIEAYALFHFTGESLSLPSSLVKIGDFIVHNDDAVLAGKIKVISHLVSVETVED